MEHLQGSTLEDELRRLAAQGEVLGEAAALRVADGVLRSLQEAHGAGLVHRDLKPGNIMLADLGEDEPTVKVLDFGIARTRDSSLTDEGTALGTPAYMSPEQCLGAELDGRADLYSLGVILYRAVTGRCAFEFLDARTMREGVQAVREGRPLPAAPTQTPEAKPEPPPKPKPDRPILLD